MPKISKFKCDILSNFQTLCSKCIGMALGRKHHEKFRLLFQGFFGNWFDYKLYWIWFNYLMRKESPTDLENLWKEAWSAAWVEKSSFTFLCIFYRIEHPLLSLFFEPPSFINFLWQINSSTVSSALICYSNYFFQSSPVSLPKKGFHERKSTIWQSLSYVPKYIIVFWIQRC